MHLKISSLSVFLIVLKLFKLKMNHQHDDKHADDHDHAAEKTPSVKTPHVHTYDAQGRQLCCTQEEKIYEKAGATTLLKGHTDDNGHDHSHAEGDGHDHSEAAAWREYLPAIASFALLMGGILLDNYVKTAWFTEGVRLVWYAAAYLPVGLPVLRDAVKTIGKGDIFSEFLLMSLATLGAFAIGEYPEGVAVMLFYAVGELFQSAAVNRAKRSIKALLDVRPNLALVLRGGNFEETDPEKVEIGDIIQVRSGEKVPLDGVMLSEGGSAFNTAALTGESRPTTIEKGSPVLAGMLNLDKVVQVEVNKKFADSSLARILDLVQNATAQKAPTEQFIRRFARIYTPIVVVAAVALVVVPYFLASDYVFRDWLYRALIFLVISCPCALVISIPLGYFGGIGAASRNGVLFKGSNFLDLITKLDTVVLDKTGTLTKGVFKVQNVVTANNFTENDLLQKAAALESQSTHPVAKAVVEYVGKTNDVATDVQEISGHGLAGKVGGLEVLAGNVKMLQKFNIAFDPSVMSLVDTIVLVAIGGKFAGYLTIADEIKPDAKAAIDALHTEGVSKIVMLSGDKSAVTEKVGKTLGLDAAFGDLLPENKVEKLKIIKAETGRTVAFVGDGINDAPSLALADIGIAMGGMGSDVAIETADVILQTDQPSKIATAKRIGLATKRIVWQNIGLAFGVKAVVLVLGAGGLATMWEAVFADVGVALLAILNAVRIQKMQF
jgi:Zn2+/Cd2+-exporting ATPase